MDRMRLLRRLRQEVAEYLADLRALGDALRSTEGRVAVALVLAEIAVVVFWFVTTLGFDRLNGVAGSVGVWRPRLCRALENFPALMLILDALVVVMFGVMAVGEMMVLFDNARRKLPTRPRNVVIPTVLMFVSGIGGVIYMRYVC